MENAPDNQTDKLESLIRKSAWLRPFNHFQEEWPIVKNAIWSFVLCAIAAAVIGGGLIHLLYSTFIIPGKDAVLAAAVEQKNSALSKLEDAKQKLSELEKTESTEKKTLADSQTKITNLEKRSSSSGDHVSAPSINTNLEVFFVRHRAADHDAYNILCSAALDEFQAGDYAYAAMFLGALDKDTAGDVNSSWQPNRPILAGAKLCQNLTSEGIRAFHQDLNSLVEKIDAQLKQSDGRCFGGEAAHVLTGIIGQLRVVEQKIPASEFDFVENEIIPKIEKLKSEWVNSQKLKL